MSNVTRSPKAIVAPPVPVIVIPVYLPSALHAGSKAMLVFSASVIVPPVVNADGVVKVGLVSVLFVNVCTVLTSTSVTHSTAIKPADTLVIVVSLACHKFIDQTPIAVDVEATNQAIGSHVALVRVQLAGVHNAHD